MIRITSEAAILVCFSEVENKQLLGKDIFIIKSDYNHYKVNIYLSTILVAFKKTWKTLKTKPGENILLLLEVLETRHMQLGLLYFHVCGFYQLSVYCTALIQY